MKKRVMESPSGSVVSGTQGKDVVPDWSKTSDEILTPRNYDDSAVSRKAEPRKVEEEVSESPELHEITGQDDDGFNLGSRLSIPIVMPFVGDMVRSVKEVSNSSSPLATVIEDPGKSWADAKKSSVLKQTASRKPSYSRSSGNARSQKQEKDAACDFENDTQEMNPTLLQESIQLKG